MKVFVYSKEPKPKKIATISHVVTVTESKNTRTLTIVTEDGTELKFNTKTLKTTIYQN